MNKGCVDAPLTRQSFRSLFVPYTRQAGRCRALGCVYIYVCVCVWIIKDSARNDRKLVPSENG